MSEKRSRDEVLQVARAHGTRVAAEWGGFAAATVLGWRKAIDGYDRGRGHPSKAEVDAMAVRGACHCPRCRVLTPDQQAMVEANTGLIGFVLNRHRVPAEAWDDAFQDGIFGLMRAAQLFDPAKGFQFSTYALHWIRQSVERGRGAFEGRSFRSAHRGRGDWHAPRSLDEPLTEDGATLAATLEGDDDPEGAALGALDSEQIGAAIAAACHDEIDRAVVRALAGGTPLSAVGLQFGLSRAVGFLRLRAIQRRLASESFRRRFDLDELLPEVAA